MLLRYTDRTSETDVIYYLLILLSKSIKKLLHGTRDCILSDSIQKIWKAIITEKLIQYYMSFWIVIYNKNQRIELLSKLNFSL